jgi:hypothetical protein
MILLRTNNFLFFWAFFVNLAVQSYFLKRSIASLVAIAKNLSLMSFPKLSCSVIPNEARNLHLGRQAGNRANLQEIPRR